MTEDTKTPPVGCALLQLREKNRRRREEWPGSERITTEFRTLEVVGEAGELAESIKKYIRARDGIAGSIAVLRDVADELADVIISADLLAEHLGIDLRLAIIRKFNLTSEKYSFDTRMVDA